MAHRPGRDGGPHLASTRPPRSPRLSRGSVRSPPCPPTDRGASALLRCLPTTATGEAAHWPPKVQRPRPWSHRDTAGAREMTTPHPASGSWRRSSYSLEEDSCCVEVADLPCSIGVRDSKDHSVLALAFPPASWSSFIAGVKGNERRG
ncbi:DUF397 domain-containing protein [Streptomyces sp. NPDC059740]|uniref:DUF397 domain-containing protein n=1 Tax=Streptomyces sp. NPDC059740 TaxID=3346926 RepID=UPI003669F59E